VLRLIEDPWMMGILAAWIGYLAGSLSFARIITRLVTKSWHIEKIHSTVPGTDLVFGSDSISATVVSQNLGKKFGCITSLLDMAKVAAPVLIMARLFPEAPYYLITGLAGPLGHNYPVYHRFKGGRGVSPTIGAMLVINWFGIIIANVAAVVLGYLTGSIVVSRHGWILLMIPWYLYYFDSFWHWSFIIGVNVLFWLGMSGDFKRFAKLKRTHHLKISQESVSEFLMMGRAYGRFIDNYGFPALLKKLFKKGV